MIASAKQDKIQMMMIADRRESRRVSASLGLGRIRAEQLF
jgi:hypothetical protein